MGAGHRYMPIILDTIWDVLKIFWKIVLGVMAIGVPIVSQLDIKNLQEKDYLIYFAIFWVVLMILVLLILLIQKNKQIAGIGTIWTIIDYINDKSNKQLSNGLEQVQVGIPQVEDKWRKFKNRIRDGITQFAEIGGKKSRRSDIREGSAFNKYIYFRVTKTFFPGRIPEYIFVTIYFFDKGNIVWSLEYDAFELKERTSLDAIIPKRTEMHKNLNTNKWRKAQFVLESAKFAKNLNDRTDFRLFVKGDPDHLEQNEDLYVHSVIVTSDPRKTNIPLFRFFYCKIRRFLNI